jgi:hypothetical protein
MRLTDSRRRAPIWDMRRSRFGKQINHSVSRLKNVPIWVSIQPSRLTGQNLAVPFSKTVLEIDSELLLYFDEF